MLCAKCGLQSKQMHHTRHAELGWSVTLLCNVLLDPLPDIIIELILPFIDVRLVQI